MTCIIAYKDEKNDIYLAGDKMGSNSFTGQTVKEPKVFWKGDFRIGYTTSFRMGQILKHVWTPPQRKVDQNTDSYLYVDVVNSLKRCFIDNGFGNKDKNNYGTFIMCYEDRMIEVQDELSLLESDRNVVSVGSGTYHATASVLAFSQYEKDVKKIFKKTYEIVGDCIVSVSKEFDLLGPKKEKK
jgi:ATP-dependent protease HslVU (ClpYQ) peptidase subunit